MTEPFVLSLSRGTMRFFQLSVFQPTVSNLMGEAFYRLSFGFFRKAVFKFVVDTRFQLERKSSLEIIRRSRNNSSKLDFM